MIKAIVFDISEVAYIIDRDKIKREFFEKTGANLAMTKEEIEKTATGKMKMGEVIKRLTNENNKNASKAIEIYYSLRDKNSWPNKNILDLIKKIKEKYSTYALSNTNNMHKEIIAKKGIYDLFDKVFLSPDIEYMKPDKKIFQYMLDNIDEKPSELVFI